MKAKFGAIVVDGRGKIGGHVASKNRFGNYFRTKTTPVNPQTPRQVAARQLFGQFTQGWGQLTPAQIEAWNARANGSPEINIFGDQVIPTGKGLYIQRNINRANVGLAPIALPLASDEFPDGVSLGVTAFDDVTVDVTATGLGASDSANILVFATGSIRNGVNFVKNKLRLIGGGQVTSVAPSLELLEAYTAVFGAPVAGQNVEFRMAFVSDSGKVSAPFIERVIAT